MWLTDLADACRRSGLRVVEQPGWKTRGHAAFSGSPQTIMCHHTAGPRNGEAPSLGVVTNGRPGLAGPLSQLVLGRSGTVYVVAAGVAWHAGNTRTAAEGNYRAIGIEAEATGVDPWPAVQYDAYVRLCRALIDHYGLAPANVVGHKEAAVPRGRKIDPNFDMNAFRTAVGRASATPGPAPASGSTNTKKAKPMILRDKLVKGRNYGRIICPVGQGTSELYSRAWVSMTAKDGGNAEYVLFQKDGAGPGPAPGAGPAWGGGFSNADRVWRAVPAGTEFIEYLIHANGDGEIMVELEPK